MMILWVFIAITSLAFWVTANLTPIPKGARIAIALVNAFIFGFSIGQIVQALA